MDQFNIAFSIGNVALTWNAIILALSILVSVVVSQILVKKRGAYKDLALDACIVGIPTGLLGGRLFSVLSGKIALSAFFNLGQAGLNLPGALLFAGAGIVIYARIKKLPLKEVFDLLTPGAFFGLAIGRWSDFFLCDGLGPVVGAGVPKFFPLVTYTAQYFTDRQTVAYAVFFLDFLVCLALAVASLLMLEKLAKGRTARITAILYLFAAFILEWLRDGSTRQIVFGDVRFNQLIWIALLGFLIGLSLYLHRREAANPAPKAEEPAPEAAEAAPAPDAPASDSEEENNEDQADDEDAGNSDAEEDEGETGDNGGTDADGGEE